LEVLGQKAQKERELNTSLSQLQGEKKSEIDVDKREKDEWKQKMEGLEKKDYLIKK